MTKKPYDLQALKDLSDLIQTRVNQSAVDLEHVLTHEHGAKFYVRNGRAYLMLANLRADMPRAGDHRQLMTNWASKARRVLVKAGSR